MTRHLRGRLVSLVACSLVAACAGDGPRALPFPTIDPEAPFLELSSKTPPPSEQDGAGGAGWVDRAVAQAQGTAAATGTVPGVSRQTVLLAGRLVAELPDRFEEWRWASDGNATLIVNSQPGSRPAALVYAEAFSGLARELPSAELLRFWLTVDPKASRPRTVLAALAIAWRAALGSEAGSVADIERGLLAGLTRTVGEGWAYRSTPDSFTGWTWVGRNQHGVALRLGRTEGAWGTPRPPVQSVLDGLATLSERAPELAGLRSQVEHLRAQTDEAARGRRPGASGGDRPAYLVFGSAVIRREAGVHLALLCTHAPRCEAAPALAALLASLRAPGAGDPSVAPSGHGAPALPDLAWSAGVQLGPVAAVPSASDLRGLLRAPGAAAKQPEAE